MLEHLQIGIAPPARATDATDATDAAGAGADERDAPTSAAALKTGLLAVHSSLGRNARALGSSLPDLNRLAEEFPSSTPAEAQRALQQMLKVVEGARDELDQIGKKCAVLIQACPDAL